MTLVLVQGFFYGIMKKWLIIFWVMGGCCFRAYAQQEVDSVEINRLRMIIQNANQREWQDSVQSEHTSDTVIRSPKIEFEKGSVDLGTIEQGKVVEYIFKFRNAGTDTLRILGVTPDCSCSTPEWSQKLISPGEEGSIRVVYDSRDDIGRVSKTLTVLHNAGEGYTFITLTGFVAAKF
jgi:hypothetical protein